MVTDRISQGAELWLKDLESALSSADGIELDALFLDESYYRDTGALTWDFHQYHGRTAIENILGSVNKDMHPHNFRLADGWPAPQEMDNGTATTIEVFFQFETGSAQVIALMYGVPDETNPYGFRTQSLYTRLEGLNGVDAPAVHPRGYGYTPSQPGENWLEHRERARSFEDREIEVLIVGAGQAGLMTAAYLKYFGVAALVIDKHDRVGDNWRKRYASLNLHNTINMNHFPLLRFPEHYPQYLPKDVLGEWLETYSRYLDLDIWASTDFVGAEYDTVGKKWAATVTTANGEQRVLNPKHIVLATGGIGGKPNIPNLPGLADFAGKVMHSSEFTESDGFAGKKALVIGMGSSAHDIARDLHNHGVQVTMVQRSPVVINSVEIANSAYAAGYADGVPIELGDLRYGLALIGPLRIAASKQAHQAGKEADAELHRGLEKAGVVLGDGYEGAGWLDLFLRTGGGYYLNAGASELIVSGDIKVIQADQINHFTGSGALLADGSTLESDLIILATGYQNRKVEVAEQFGDDIAERIGDIARLSEEGEWANMWSQTAQRGLWFSGGGIPQVRPGARILALLIKADLLDLIPDRYRRDAQVLTAQ
ncbi:flavin-containing monooxygenase [Rhodococcus koreensis]